MLLKVGVLCLTIGTFNTNASKSSLFLDDFSQGLTKWKKESGNWSVRNGECVARGLALLTTGNNEWNDYVCEVKMKTDRIGVDGVTKKEELYDVAFLFFRYIDSNNFYSIGLYADGTLVLQKKLNGISKELKKVLTDEADPLEWNTFKVEAKGANIKVYLNGDLLIDYTDNAPINNGRIALRSLWGDAIFDDVSVYEIENILPDNVPKVSASSTYPSYLPENAIDGKIEHYLNRWVSAPGETMPQWLTIDFGEKKSFYKVCILWDGQQEGAFIPVEYLLQYWDDNDNNWKTIKTVTDNRDVFAIYQFPEVVSDKFRLYITRVPEAAKSLVRLYEIAIMDKSNKNICSATGFNLLRYISSRWETGEKTAPIFHEMAHYWWYGKGRFFADGTRLKIDMHYSTPTKKSVIPEDTGKMFGMILYPPYPLKKDVTYQFCLIFEAPPDYILVNGYKVWDIKENRLKRRREILFTYTPKEDNEKMEIVLVKDPSYGTAPILQFGKGDSGHEPNIKYRKLFISSVDNCSNKEKVSLPDGLIYYTIPDNHKMGYFGDIHKIPVEWTGGFPDRKDYPVDDCQTFIWWIFTLSGCKLANKTGVDAFIWGTDKYTPEQLEGFNPRALLFYDSSAGWSFREKGASYWGDIIQPIRECIDKYNYCLQTFPSVEIWVGYLEQFWRDRYLKNNPEWANLLEQKNRFDWLRATFKINTQWKENILKETLSPERVKFLYDSNGAAWPMAYYHHQGADILGNKSIGRQNCNIVLANVRGAATTYNKKSFFTADPYPCWIKHQYSPEEYEQFLYAGYFGGADIIGVQCGDFFVRDLPNPAGVKILEFAKFTKTHPLRGKQVIKIGIVRGFGDMWSFIYCPGSDELETNMFSDNKDNADYNLLDIFYPEFGDYKHTNPDRWFTGTPYGDIDMLPWDAPLEKLKEYSLIIYTGINAMDDKQYEKLKEYVKQGGKLIMACGHLQKEGGDILTNFDPADSKEEIIERDIFRNDVSDLFGVEIGNKEGDIYRLKISDAQVVSEINNQPLIVKKSTGKGEAYLFATKHLTTTKQGEQEARRIIKQMADNISLIEFSPKSEWLQYFIQKKDDIYILSFLNHGRMKYPAGNGPDYGIYKGAITLKFDLPQDCEAFEVNTTDMSLKSIPVYKRNNKTVFNISVDKKTEIVIGPAGKTANEFFHSGKR